MRRKRGGLPRRKRTEPWYGQRRRVTIRLVRKLATRRLSFFLTQSY